MPEALAAGQVGLATVWLLGLSMGMTACTVTCLPFMGTWALGRGGGSREHYRHLVAFLAGRVAAYTLLAASAGALGAGLVQSLSGPWGNAAIGAASILAGLWLLRRPAASCSDGRQTRPVRFLAAATGTRRETRDGLPPLLLGAALSLTPCTPLASLLALAAQAGGSLAGGSFGLAFGLGAAVTPLLVLVPLAGRLGRELRSGRAWLGRWLTWAAALTLVVLGLNRLLLVN
jgi:thiol:disulfide interchange protein DsbD